MKHVWPVIAVLLVIVHAGYASPASTRDGGDAERVPIDVRELDDMVFSDKGEGIHERFGKPNGVIKNTEHMYYEIWRYHVPVKRSAHVSKSFDLYVVFDRVTGYTLLSDVEREKSRSIRYRPQEVSEHALKQTHDEIIAMFGEPFKVLKNERIHFLEYEANIEGEFAGEHSKFARFTISIGADGRCDGVSFLDDGIK